MSGPHRDRDADRDRESERNPFVTFRRYTDDQLASMFRVLVEPFDHPSTQDQFLRDGHLDPWQRFAAHYERATNPERRQSESRGRDDPVNASISDGSRITRPGLLGRWLGMMGKTTQDEERQRAFAMFVKDAGTLSSDGDSVSKTPVARVSVCPRVSASLSSSDDGNGEQFDGEPRVKTWSCSFGPWTFDSRPTTDRDSEPAPEESRSSLQSFGPWTFGPFSMSASFPKEVEEEFARAFGQLKRHQEEALGRLGLLPEPEADEHAHPQDAMALGSFSPSNLEQTNPTASPGQWQRAFDDLLTTTTMESRQEPQPTSPSVSDSEHLREMGHNPQTELEFYEGLSGSYRQVQPHTTPRDLAAADDSDNPPGLLSTMTTVERTMLPDGSTRTTRRLRRRFADGREESHDTDETTPPTQPAASPAKSPEPTKPTEQFRKERGHWFWS